MKKISFFMVMSFLFVSVTMAETKIIEMETKWGGNTYIPTYTMRVPMVLKAFGKTLFGEEYGVSVHIDGQGRETSDYDAIFYPTEGEIKRINDQLIYSNENETFVLANKTFLGWKNTEGVKIHTQLIDHGMYYHLLVSIHINN